MNYISTNWNPLKSTLFSRHIDDLFDDGDLFFKKQRGLSSSWNPATDVLEDENSFIIETELPRLNKKDITIEVNDSILKFSGEKLQTKLDEKQKIHQRESFHGRFSKSFKLPESTAVDKIEAKFENGVLKIIVPKTEKSKNLKQNIQIS